MSFSREFRGEGDFQALYAAQEFLTARGFSYGSWEKGAPCGVLHGDYLISKWRNLSAAERGDLHGVLEGSARNGPITFIMRDDAPPEALRAASLSPENNHD